MKKVVFYLVFFIFCITGCRRPQPTGKEVRVRLMQDPESLNPVSYTSKDAAQLINLLFQSLLTVDLADGKLKPLLAEEMPLIERKDTLTLITYTIRPEAAWTNGSPVTATDVAFSLKVRKCPLVNNEKVRPDYEFILDLIPDKSNPKKFTLVCGQYSPEHLLLSGDFFVMPAYLFDPQNQLGSFTLPQFANNFDALAAESAIQQFADRFNSADFTRNPKYLQGSAGYVLEKWTTGQRLTFKRKEDWWGTNLKAPETGYITARPDQIAFRIIPDNAAALVSLKNKQLDVWQNIPASVFTQIQKDKEISEAYNFSSPQTYTFVYLGLNGRSDKLADKVTRQALAQLVNTDELINVVQHKLAVKTVGPVSPLQKEYYNGGITPYSYNPAEAEKLLRAAGWQKNGTGWAKKVRNEMVPLTLSISYNASNSEFANMALLFQQAAAKAGIPVTLQPQESGLFTQNLKGGNFEVFIRSLTGNPFVYNFKPILHTESIGPDGLNYTGFGTPESDRLIEALYNPDSEKEKNENLKRLQAILHEESNLVFLFFLRDRIAVNKQFSDTKISGIKPGYDVSAFKSAEAD
ncbi:ABC transporter substrate-binding protein [Adhaeribacter soli]|uniref:ABC transporter substrate-binding protein n=1 Tax=Adhaeribacter soli TaxID=2607655 RepID=A0A5N1IHA4_9BACT|nr:ABC transporter substrate-binding protein [Adhaeribacter soli]KAA9325035.1 ABC transporter substrate-binding protein [Adhaeribacter soli]